MPLALAAALALSGLQAAPADRAAACKTVDASLPPELLGWETPGDELAVGKAARLDTIDAATLKGLPAGAKPGRAASIAFAVEAPGTYGIALDQPGWIDLQADAPGAKPLESAAHGHGPDCSSIRKIVRFALQPGRYRLFVSGLAKAEAKVMLVSGG